MEIKEIEEIEVKLDSVHYTAHQYADGYRYRVSTRRAVEGEYILGYATGISGKGRGHFIHKHTGDAKSRLLSICEDSYTILWTDNKEISS